MDRNFFNQLYWNRNSQYPQYPQQYSYPSFNENIPYGYTYDQTNYPNYSNQWISNSQPVNYDYWSQAPTYPNYYFNTQGHSNSRSYYPPEPYYKNNNNFTYYSNLYNRDTQLEPRYPPVSYRNTSLAYPLALNSFGSELDQVKFPSTIYRNNNNNTSLNYPLNFNNFDTEPEVKFPLNSLRSNTTANDNNSSGLVNSSSIKILDRESDGKFPLFSSYLVNDIYKRPVDYFKYIEFSGKIEEKPDTLINVSHSNNNELKSNFAQNLVHNKNVLVSSRQINNRENTLILDGTNGNDTQSLIVSEQTSMQDESTKNMMPTRGFTFIIHDHYDFITKNKLKSNDFQRITNNLSKVD
ncbi:unnamed protein product [Brachionus calyciflorus]|uniref:Uncharacterized protein n=1 Tax=Brachionus calyciflorus TaxID=104777 RepID=A0A814AGV4_9BILA|nr:unnamed protein product [Brachionus calyciflorus]